MKTRGYLALAVGLTLLLAACTSTSEPGQEYDPAPTLVGVWVLEGNEADGVQVFARAASLSGDHPGYEFSEHGGLQVRKPGWCGTPPLTWLNHEGLWSRMDDRLLDIRHALRGGHQEYMLEIISLSARRMTCREHR